MSQIINNSFDGLLISRLNCQIEIPLSLMMRGLLSAGRSGARDHNRRMNKQQLFNHPKQCVLGYQGYPKANPREPLMYILTIILTPTCRINQAIRKYPSHIKYTPSSMYVIMITFIDWDK